VRIDQINDSPIHIKNSQHDIAQTMLMTANREPLNDLIEPHPKLQK